jgi:hypothetical protein
LSIRIKPSLQPAFDPAIPNYVVRCQPIQHVEVSVSAPGGTPVSVAGRAARTGRFRMKLPLVAGQRLVIRTGSGVNSHSYNFRCLPADFPGFGIVAKGAPQAAYYLLTPTDGRPQLGPPYVVLFDNDGVPIWWYQELNGVPTNASLLSDGDLAWDLDSGSLYGYPETNAIEIRRLDGSLVRTLASAIPSPIDSLELTQMPNGDFLVSGYALHQNVNLTAIGAGVGPVLDATFQEIRPDGTAAFSWQSNGRLPAPESQRWWFALTAYAHETKPVWDWQHIDSVAPDADGYLVSMRDDDAVYLVRRSDGAIEWKLGGTPTLQSLNVIGTPGVGQLFGGPNDARVLPDGTISVHDNGTFLSRPPRVLRFEIDPLTRTATVLQVLNGPSASVSPCCGSARMLPGGDWVVDWGGTGVMEERAANGALVLRLSFHQPYYSYRAFPVPPGRLSARRLIANMDAMLSHASRNQGGMSAG